MPGHSLNQPLDGVQCSVIEWGMASFWTGTRVRLRGIEPDDWAAFMHFAVDEERLGDVLNPPRSAEGYRAWAREQAAAEPGITPHGGRADSHRTSHPLEEVTGERDLHAEEDDSRKQTAPGTADEEADTRPTSGSEPPAQPRLSYFVSAITRPPPGAAPPLDAHEARCATKSSPTPRPCAPPRPA
ncbi:hypothetical protein [Streptomyces sp. NPDC047869]|uniref:hypothetical protein n=1 Tax=Streptomyces sp. NPDC047869 TaxID=3154709 RepID=UPI003454CCD4